MSTSARKNRRFRARIKQHASDEELTRFGRLVGFVCVIEAGVLLWVMGVIRPL